MNTSSQHQSNLFSNLYDQLSQSQPQASPFVNSHSSMSPIVSQNVITIKVLRSLDGQQQDQQLLQSFDLSSYLHHKTFKVENLIKAVSEEMNILIDGHQIFLYFYEGQLYVNFGTYPLLETNQAQLSDFCLDNILIIKLKKNAWSLMHMQMSMDISAHLMDGPPKLIESSSLTEGGKRQSCVKNFQKIGYIVKKILSIKNNNRRKNMSFNFKNDRNLTKKSVEDYFYQIKQGYKYNFDFNSNSNRNMKYLREFVKTHDDRSKRISDRTDTTTTNNVEHSNSISIL